MTVLRGLATPFRLSSIYDWADESDVAVALVRTAFLIVLILVLLQQPSHTVFPSEVVILVGAVFNLILFISYLRRARVPLRRPVALAIDVVLVTIAALTFGDFPHQRDQIVALYYLVVMVGALAFSLAVLPSAPFMKAV